MDGDLNEIRQKRMAEMKAQQESESERKSQMLHSILEPDARERLSRISIVKPEKAAAVQDLIIRLASGGRLGKRISEKDLIDLLNQTNQQSQAPQVIIQRRKYSDDEDDDY
eukprot:Partr_v1_DN28698_c0_g1_i1_m50161 putative Programmed cell death